MGLPVTGGVAEELWLSQPLRLGLAPLERLAVALRLCVLLVL